MIKHADIRPGYSCIDMCLNKFYLFGAANARVKKARVQINREGKAFNLVIHEKMQYLI